MRLRTASLLLGATLAVPAAAQAATVTVRVEGAHRTLVSQRSVRTTGAPVVKDGDPSHRCPGHSAAGALERATHGHWKGTWSPGLGYFVSAIRGEAPRGRAHYFTFWLDGRPSSTGLCDTTLHRGDDVLLYVDDVAHPVLPLAVHAPRRGTAGRRVTVRVVALQPKGRPRPAAHVAVRRGRHRLGRTNRHGRLRVRLPRHRRAVTLTASGGGFARSGPTVVKVRGA